MLIVFVYSFMFQENYYFSSHPCGNMWPVCPQSCGAVIGQVTSQWMAETPPPPPPPPAAAAHTYPPAGTGPRWSLSGRRLSVLLRPVHGWRRGGRCRLPADATETHTYIQLCLLIVRGIWQNDIMWTAWQYEEDCHLLKQILVRGQDWKKKNCVFYVGYFFLECMLRWFSLFRIPTLSGRQAAWQCSTYRLEGLNKNYGSTGGQKYVIPSKRNTEIL